MTYFEFLAIFLLGPLTVLGALNALDRRRRGPLPRSLRGRPLWVALGVHVLVALVYTAPWDNYLVANGVWWYDPALVTGITLGWVPLEEYVFFALQPLLAGLWLAWVARRLPGGDAEAPARPTLRRASTAATGLLWLASVAALVGGWKPLRYLALELVWALPAIMGQLIFGADILYHRRRLVALVLVPATLFLSAADALAIYQGIWAIDPAQSLNFFLGGILPIEEFAFFLLTNTLLTLGVVLFLSQESRSRAGLDRVRPRGRVSRNSLAPPGAGGSR
jgi:lycopene cyclase domain-containing protein